MSGPIIVRCLQRDDDVAVVGKGKALLRNSWPRNVPASRWTYSRDSPHSPAEEMKNGRHNWESVRLPHS